MNDIFTYIIRENKSTLKFCFSQGTFLQPNGYSMVKWTLKKWNNNLKQTNSSRTSLF